MDYAKAIQDAYDGFAKGDPGALFSLFDPKIEWTEAEGIPYGGTYVGADEIGQKVFGRLQADWDPLSVVPDTIVVQDERAVVIGTYRGTSRETGRSFQARFAHSWQFVGDKLVKFEQVVDSAKLNEAL